MSSARVNAPCVPQEGTLSSIHHASRPAEKQVLGVASNLLSDPLPSIVVINKKDQQAILCISSLMRTHGPHVYMG